MYYVCVSTGTAPCILLNFGSSRSGRRVSRCCHLSPGERATDRHSIAVRMDLRQGPNRRKKFSLPLGSRSADFTIVTLVSNHCTDWAIPVPHYTTYIGLSKSMVHSSFLKLTVCRSVKKPSALLWPERSLLYSQGTATEQYPEPSEFSPKVAT